MATREASHAGSWYSSDPSRLSRELDGFLDAAGTHGSTPRALIVPHAGYSYSGAAAAWGYKNVDARAGIRRVFLLGPSHHVFLRRCALSKCATYATPLGNLAVDTGIYDELRATGHFVDMDVDVDEAEHSLELHLPYIFKCFEVEEPEHQRRTGRYWPRTWTTTQTYSSCPATFATGANGSGTGRGTNTGQTCGYTSRSRRWTERGCGS
jgi:hypothetical protein